MRGTYKTVYSRKKLDDEVMLPDPTISFKLKKSLLVFVLSVLIPLFWYLGQLINVYKYAWMGTLFEILWLPMLAALFILPVLSFILLVKNKFNPRSLYLYSFIVS